MISKFSVKKPLTIFVAVILIIILGFISFNKMTTDLLPSMEFPYVIVTTAYPGASSEKVEINVTKPLESILATTSGIKNVNSTSNENVSTIMLEFEQNVNMDSVLIEINSKIDLVKGKFDQSVQNPMVLKINPDMLPIMMISVDIDGASQEELSKKVKEEIIPEFEKITNVASVEGTGIIEKTVEINLNQDKIDELNDKILKIVDSKLAEAQTEIEDGKSKLSEGKRNLENEGNSKTKELLDAEAKLIDGEKQINAGISQMEAKRSELTETLNSLKKQKESIDVLLKLQDKLCIKQCEKEKELVKRLNDGIEGCNTGINIIDSQKKQLEEKLSSITDSKIQIENAKIILTRELTKASVEISQGEKELEKATEEFEKQREEAYKKANLSGIITKDMISKFIMASNFSMPVGYIEHNDDSKTIVKVGDTFASIDELRDLVLINMELEGLQDIHLYQVADIVETDNAESMYAKINGNNGIVLSFQKQSGTSTAEVSEAINVKISELENKIDGVHLTQLYDQGVYIGIVVDSVINNLISGGILAIIILFLFLKNIKTTLIVGISIPVSVMFAIVLMYFSNVNLNVISLSGLALGVGMLVDNSIVVIENIFRLRSLGCDIKEAAVKGAKQVGGAIVASTLTTVCVFLPIVFTQGISRQLFTDMGLTIAYSLLASLIIALTAIPAMASIMLKKDKEKENKYFNKFVNIYGKLLEKVLRNKFKFLSVIVLLLVFSVYIAFNMGTAFFPNMTLNQMTMSLSPLDEEMTKEEVRAISDEVVDKVLQIEDIQTIGAVQSDVSNEMGLSLGGNSGDNLISYYIIIDPDSEYSNEEIKKQIEDKTADVNCKLSINTSTMDMSALTGSGISVVIKGNNLDKLKEISKDVASILKDTEGTKDVSDGLEEGNLETRIIVDKNKAGAKGLTVAQVYQYIAEALKTEVASTNLNINETEYAVVVKEDSKNKLEKSELENYIINYKDIQGNEKEVKLKDIARVEDKEGLNVINHVSQVRSLKATAQIDENHNIGLVSKEFEKKLAEYKVPEGYSISIEGENKQIKDVLESLIYMIILAIVFIYGIMVSQFQSLLSPFIVLFTIPLAFTGGIIGLLITGKELSIVSMLGFLILAGIIVNNGIVFVDYVNQLIEEGIPKREALIKAGKTRIRPILMTTVTTILGLSTMALGIGTGAVMGQPMAIVTIAGLIYATILTLFVVPSIYDILHREKNK